MKSCSVFHIEQKMEFEKFNCFFIDFLRYSFGRIKVISTVVEREYTPDINWQICFAYQLTDFYMLRGFTERYFLADYIYILENTFISQMCPTIVLKLLYLEYFDSSVKVLSPQYGDLSTHIFRTSSLWTFINYRKKEIGRFRS